MFPTIKTDRLVLREYRHTDIEAVYDIFSWDMVTKYYTLDTMKILERAEKLVRDRMSLFIKGIGTRWATTLRGGTDQSIGFCGYSSPNENLHSVEIGYDLHPDQWRQGIMTEALTAMIGFCYSEDLIIHLNRIRALTEIENTAAKSLLGKLGFEEEGMLREHSYWKDQFQDVECYSLLRTEWKL